MRKISTDNLPVGIFRMDWNKELIYANHYFCEITGYPKNKLLGHFWLHLLHPDDKETFIPALSECMDAGTSHLFEFRFLHANNDSIWVFFHIVPEKIMNETASYIGSVIDISELKKSQASLRKLARFDQLTNLPNRYLFDDTIQARLSRSKRNKTTMALFYIDVDYFKNVNDFYGHCIGDELLVKVGKRFVDNARGGDFIARLGGDEFAIILEDFSSITSILNSRPNLYLHVPHRQD